MPWSRPAARMREYVLALRAIWQSWQDGGKLDFDGEFYRHTLMTPIFSPGPLPSGPPRVLIAAVGDVMTGGGGRGRRRPDRAQLHHPPLPAGGHPADGAGGLARGGRAEEDFDVVYAPFVVTGADERVDGGLGGRRPRAHRLLRLHRVLPAASSSCTAGATCRPR